MIEYFFSIEHTLNILFVPPRIWWLRIGNVLRAIYQSSSSYRDTLDNFINISSTNLAYTWRYLNKEYHILLQRQASCLSSVNLIFDLLVSIKFVFITRFEVSLTSWSFTMTFILLGIMVIVVIRIDMGAAQGTQGRYSIRIQK